MLANQTSSLSLPQQQSLRKAQTIENNANSRSEKKKIWVDHASNTS
jgi:hypothetical protein